ncbi:MAG: hypothetical protein V4729_07570 [Pseudomonadota bacterium]
MSNSTLPNANRAAAALLHLGVTLTAALAAMFFVVRFGPELHAGEAALYLVALIGSALVLRSAIRLFRDLTSPMATPISRRPLKH